MPVNSLAKIFGPTIVGHASSNPKDNVILQDTEKQPKVMMRLLGIAEEYWRQYMSEEVHPELAASPMFPRSPSSAYSPSPGPFRSPSTPEPRPGNVCSLSFIDLVDVVVMPTGGSRKRHLVYVMYSYKNTYIHREIPLVFRQVCIISYHFKV